MVGDSESDAEAAANAGIDFYLVNKNEVCWKR